MNCKLSIALAFALLFLCGISYAQTTVRLQRKGDKYSGAAVTGGREKVMSGVRSDLKGEVNFNANYNDETLDELA